MTNREYILGKLSAFEVSDAQLADLPVDLDAEYTAGNATVGRAIVSFVEELALAPHRTNISENGFSVSWDMKDLGKYYMWLCRKYGVKPNADVTSMMGMSMITDMTDKW